MLTCAPAVNDKLNPAGNSTDDPLPIAKN